MVGLKTQNDLEIALRQNMWLGEILERFEEIVLPDCWLVAGAIAQTIWNLRCEQPAEFGLKDVDLIYFDEQDLSFEAEASHERRLRGHTGPPLGLSRDLIIRGRADKLQERAHGGPSRALQRRLQTLAGELEKGARSFDPGMVLKTGASLVRQWRGHTHTVLVREDGFEYEGQRYRSLSVIAEQITGAHWSGPRFFGVNKRARAS